MLKHFLSFTKTFITVVLEGLAVHISLSPPNPPVKDQNCSVPDTLFEQFVQSITFFSKCVIWVGAIWDILATLTLFVLHTHLHHSDSIAVMRRVCPNMNDPTALWMTHSVMFVGTIATVVAATLRIWCFKTLGRLFTFEIAIRPKHELITSGPYAWVRHPSYTGIYLTLFGATASLCSPGTWLLECGFSSRSAIILVSLWLLKCAFVFRGMALRLIIEDEVLKKAFGESWDEYARRVPYKFVPCAI